jgi:hypothetical protein
LTDSLADDRQLGPEAKAIHVLSSRIRAIALVLVTIFALAAAILLVHKPVTRDADLVTATYSPDIARRLVQKCGPELQAIFERNANVLDSPYSSIAKAYIRGQTEDARTEALRKYLNEPAPARAQHLALIVESRRIAQVLNEYIEASKSRWQTFKLPLVDFEVSRNEVACFLGIAFAALHLYLVAMRLYLLRLRASSPSLDFLPDPSLLTATPRDLQVLGIGSTRIVRLGQVAAFYAVPFVMAAMLTVFLMRSAEGEFDDYDRTKGAICVAFVEGLLALVWQLRGNRTGPTALPLFRAATAGDTIRAARERLSRLWQR